jgi:hypothetical protein
MTLPTIKELEDRAQRLQSEVDTLQRQLGHALLRGDTAAADGIRGEIALRETDQRDVVCMGKVLPSLLEQDAAERRDEHEAAIHADREKSVPLFEKELASFRSGNRKVDKAERKKWAGNVRALARRANKVTRFKEVMADMARQYNDNAYTSY